MARRAIQAGIEGQFDYDVCPMMLAEFEAVSRRPKISRLLPETAAERFIVDLRGGARMQPDPQVRSVSRDPKDDYLIALAVRVGSDHLVTGDRDLLDLADPPVRITALRSFVHVLDEEYSARPKPPG
ncbi:MAG: putative toxin-antitoxin system toxin component, PIN family [Acidimicrobiales bacterium]